MATQKDYLNQINEPSLPLEDEIDSDTEDLLKDIADINWDEDVFSDIQSASIYRENNSEEFKRNYVFSREMLDILHIKFGIRSFRPLQREIIDAILNGHDCFVLMPTGGGKSLCYQLPAILNKGVTVVISPLIALIMDQVDKLNTLDIRSAHLCSTLSSQESKEVFAKLSLNEPEIDLLYLTPERIMVSQETKDMLESLYKRGKLTRFVFDEVHCLSLWGHDFRPDYKKLVLLREKYSDIQIICFTATATKQVETDVIVNLKLRDVKKFVFSFNRPNIKYQVIDKREKMPVFEMVTLINNKFFRKCGIIYCLTRRDCVDLSQYLRNMGIAARPYHAGLDNEVRAKTQREWMQDQFHVMVATIAFGMGIDKPDVRFVIHNTIPKSLENYYQESGRAGRDGEVSYSYIFYYYKDVLRTYKLMESSFSNRDTLDGQLDNMQQMVAFVNNQVDCRRYLQLLNLGEHFDRQMCIENQETVCDNCENIGNTVPNQIDITKQAKELSALVQDIAGINNITLNTVAKVYKGSNEKIIKRFVSHKYYGRGRLMTRLDIHRILRDLIISKVLSNHYITTGEFPLVYMKPGSELQTFLNSLDIKMTIPIPSNRSIRTEYLETEYSIRSASKGIIPSVSVCTATIGYHINKILSQCQGKLLDLCRNQALEKGVSVTSILHPIALKNISEILPGNREQLLAIPHVTVALFNKIGENILGITNYFKRQILSLQDDSEYFVHRSPNKRTFTDAFSSSNNNNNGNTN